MGSSESGSAGRTVDGEPGGPDGVEVDGALHVEQLPDVVVASAVDCETEGAGDAYQRPRDAQ